MQHKRTIIVQSTLPLRPTPPAPKVDDLAQTAPEPPPPPGPAVPKVDKLVQTGGRDVKLLALIATAVVVIGAAELIRTKNRP